MTTSAPNSIFDELKTDKSDKTINISNDGFLQAIFGDLSNCDKHPVIVSFKGDPANKQNWFGKPWNNTSELTLAHDANNYFSLACFKPNEKGEYRRMKSQFYALYSIMLDDIATKISSDRITLVPSWVLETSPSNFQIGYILAEPITESELADQLMSAVIDAGLCDSGANGPTARLARLPVAINGKQDPLFHCKLKSWMPEKRYSVSDLLDAYQLELVEKAKTKKQHSIRLEKTGEIDSEQIWTPCPKENMVLAALKARDLYKSPLSEGKHDITCPWVNEHTGAVNGGSAYFEPDYNHSIGGFKCFHGHCNDRSINDLLRFLNVDMQSARMKSTIRIIKGEIDRIVDIAEQELAATQRYYQRGGLIVCIYTDSSTKQVRIQETSKSALVRVLSGIATWEQFDKRSENFVRMDPPERHVSILFDSNSYRHLLTLNGLTHQPYLRADGSLMKEADYDLDTGMFGVFDSRQFSIPDKPTLEEAQAALKLLNELLNEFCFATEEDKAAALSAILTAAIRPSLSNAPMMHVRAHAVGSGKSYLCALITAFATPQQGTPTSFPSDDEECRKLLLAALLRSPAVIEFDNITSDILPHKSLCTVLTSEFFEGRILGLSKTATVSTRTLFLSSGNNVTPIKDMARRCISIKLNPEYEIPAARTFKRPNLIQEVLKDRGRYVSAAITIIRAWIVAEKPKTTCNSFAGFDDWSEYCRYSLLWLGCADPAASIFEAIKEDPDRELVRRLLIAWQALFGNTPTMVRDAVNKAVQVSENNELNEILHDIADERGQINRRRLGRWIKRHEGQIVDGLRFIRCSGNTSAERWRVELVS